jgi:hypothetical protein
MKRLVVLLVLSLPVACATPAQTPAAATAPAAPTAATAASSEPVTPHLREQRASATVTRLTSKDFAGCREWFDATMRDQLSESTLRDVWSQAEEQLGAFKQASLNGAIRVQGHVALDYALTFTKGNATARVVFDDDGMIAGLFLKPAGN